MIAVVRCCDPYPFILLNLALSFQAAYTGPVLLIASNRRPAKDRDLAEHGYQVELQSHPDEALPGQAVCSLVVDDDSMALVLQTHELRRPGRNARGKRLPYIAPAHGSRDCPAPVATLVPESLAGMDDANDASSHFPPYCWRRSP